MTVEPHGPCQSQRYFVRHAVTIVMVALLAESLAHPVRAAEPSAATVGVDFNWYYATSFGTGVYRFQNTTVTALAFPLYYTLQEPDENHWEWRLTAPTTIALGNFDLHNPDLSQINSANLAALSIMPGAELIIPLRSYWRINTFANVGRAKEFESGAGASVYQAGTSTWYRVPMRRDPELELGAKYIYAGYTADGADSTPVSLVSLGIAASVPLSWTISEGRQTRFGLHVIGTSYLTDIRFQLGQFGFTEIHGEWATGFTIALRPGVKWLGVTWDRIGLSRVRADDGLRGVRLVTDFPF